ncbi:MAG: response regulator, partial [Pseudobdellovibrionaceae bacterium]
GGVGLGLSIVSAIVERMHGTISLHSEVGIGTQIKIRLPLPVIDPSVWFTQAVNVDLLRRKKFLVVTEDLTLEKQLISYLSLAQSRVETSQGISFEVLIGNKYDFYLVDRSLISLESLLKLNLNQRQRLIVIEPDLLSQIQEGSLFYPITPTNLFSAIGVLNSLDNSIATKSLSVNRFAAPENLSLVVVDDDPFNRELIAAYLKDQDWDVRFAEDGRTALSLCIQKPPDILIADLQMPYMDGFTLSEKLKEHQKNQNSKLSKIVILTADALEETAEQAKAYAIDVYLTKPIRKTSFIEVIQSLR